MMMEVVKMIKVSNPKIKDVFQGMHEALLRKVKRGSRSLRLRLFLAAGF